MAAAPTDRRDEPPAQRSAAHLRDVVRASLDDDKAADIVEIDLSEKSSVTDVMIVASGRSQRHVSAIANHALRSLKDVGVKNLRVEGLANADWVLIDAGDLVLHLFRPEVRDFYNLEKLWDADAPGPKALADDQA